MLVRVRSGGILGFRRLVRQLGGDPARLLGDVGLLMDGIGEHDAYIPYRNVLMAFDHAATELDVPDFGLRLAAMQDLSVLGTLGLAIQSARDLREGVLIASRYMHFHTPGFVLSIEGAGTPGFEVVKFQFRLDDCPPFPQASEHAVSHICKLVTVLSHGGLQPHEIHLMHDRISPVETYVEHLGVKPVFASQFNGALLDRAAMRRRLPPSNEGLQRFLEKFLLSLSPPPHLNTDEQVRTVLPTLIRAGPVTLAGVAQILRLHPRTLQRRLQTCGTSFEEVFDQARREIVCEMLTQGNIPLADIAHIVGFSEQPVLTRACRRWFNATPGAVRKSGDYLISKSS